MLSVTLTLTLSFFRVGSFCSAFWIWLCSVAVSFTLPPVVVADGPAVLGVGDVPALEPMAPAVVPDCCVVVLGVVAPVTPPVVVGVLVPDCAVAGPWPAMLVSLEALPVLCGALDGFSPVAGLADAVAEELVVPVWLGVPAVPAFEDVVVELLGGAVADVLGSCPALALDVVVFDCEAIVSELVVVVLPVVLDA